jgi:polyhydroxyalkanoate synthase
MADFESMNAAPGAAGAAGGAEKAPMPSLEDLQYWTSLIGRAQQMMMTHSAEMVLQSAGESAQSIAQNPILKDIPKIVKAQADFWMDSVHLWQRFLSSSFSASPSPADRDRRFSSPEWRDNPLFDLIRQSYLLVANHLLKGVEDVEGIDERERTQLRFVTQSLVDAMSPSNFVATNPQVLARIFETRGENLLRGLEHMLSDVEKGQLTQSNMAAFELGKNIAATPGKVIRETPLYQLIQYSPTTPEVDATPLLIFPPWINRFYILDLNPKNSFIRWAVDQGLTVFVVSWKSADSSMADILMDDYVLRGQIDAIETVRDLLDVPSAHVIGYCVAGTALAMTLAWLAAQGRADHVASATFLTAQVDFADSGDLKLFVTDEQLALISQLAAGKGYLDGRYMAATFNLLRSRDLIWSYVVNNYLLGEDYSPFDLLYWNSQTTNLPAKWHRAYLEQLYRDNLLVQPGALTIGGTPIDLSLIRTPAYIQAGREDHIAPLKSVWKLTEQLKGPQRFVIAGSGHIAGVVNPPAAKKYQYWVNEKPRATLDEFVANAKEQSGSWWPDWRAWLAEMSTGTVMVNGARVPGDGRLKVIEDAPGRYARPN